MSKMFKFLIYIGTLIIAGHLSLCPMYRSAPHASQALDVAFNTLQTSNTAITTNNNTTPVVDSTRAKNETFDELAQESQADNLARNNTTESNDDSIHDNTTYTPQSWAVQDQSFTQSVSNLFKKWTGYQGFQNTHSALARAKNPLTADQITQLKLMLAGHVAQNNTALYDWLMNDSLWQNVEQKHIGLFYHLYEATQGKRNHQFHNLINELRDILLQEWERSNIDAFNNMAQEYPMPTQQEQARYIQAQKKTTSQVPVHHKPIAKTGMLQKSRQWHIPAKTVMSNSTPQVSLNNTQHHTDAELNQMLKNSEQMLVQSHEHITRNKSMMQEEQKQRAALVRDFLLKKEQIELQENAQNELEKLATEYSTMLHNVTNQMHVEGKQALDRQHIREQKEIQNQKEATYKNNLQLKRKEQYDQKKERKSLAKKRTEEEKLQVKEEKTQQLINEKEQQQNHDSNLSTQKQQQKKLEQKTRKAEKEFKRESRLLAEEAERDYIHITKNEQDNFKQLLQTKKDILQSYQPDLTPIFQSPQQVRQADTDINPLTEETVNLAALAPDKTNAKITHTQPTNIVPLEEEPFSKADTSDVPQQSTKNRAAHTQPIDPVAHPEPVQAQTARTPDADINPLDEEKVNLAALAPDKVNAKTAHTAESINIAPLDEEPFSTANKSDVPQQSKKNRAPHTQPIDPVAHPEPVQAQTARTPDADINPLAEEKVNLSALAPDKVNAKTAHAQPKDFAPLDEEPFSTADKSDASQQPTKNRAAHTQPIDPVAHPEPVQAQTARKSDADINPLTEETVNLAAQAPNKVNAKTAHTQPTNAQEFEENTVPNTKATPNAQSHHNTFSTKETPTDSNQDGSNNSRWKKFRSFKKQWKSRHNNLKDPFTVDIESESDEDDNNQDKGTNIHTQTENNDNFDNYTDDDSDNDTGDDSDKGQDNKKKKNNSNNTGDGTNTNQNKRTNQTNNKTKTVSQIHNNKPAHTKNNKTIHVPEKKQPIQPYSTNINHPEKQRHTDTMKNSTINEVLPKLDTITTDDFYDVPESTSTFTTPEQPNSIRQTPLTELDVTINNPQQASDRSKQLYPASTSSKIKYHQKETKDKYNKKHNIHNNIQNIQPKQTYHSDTAQTTSNTSENSSVLDFIYKFFINIIKKIRSWL
ncbi:MAG: hypothetical protein CL947_01070 [Epsilonproteobacteria bacterium]|nr:hypothetical protein [Campylobacterota bacterium]